MSDATCRFDPADAPIDREEYEEYERRRAIEQEDVSRAENQSMRAIVESLLELSDESALFADGFDEAILGIHYSGFSDAGPVVVYDSCKCIEILTQSMERKDAVEYFEFNVLGAYVGPKSPVFVITGVL